MASIRDVAKEAGVSPATVSRTFTTPNLINAQTQQRVLAAARSLEYCPPRLRNPRAAFLAPRKKRLLPVSESIGFLFVTATDSADDTLAANGFYMPVLFGAQAEASSLGLNFLVHTTNRQAISSEMPRMVYEQAIGGLLLVGAVDASILPTLSKYVPDIVLLDNHDETKTHESVVSDGFAGSLDATRYLIGLGHRRIGFFLTEAGVSNFQDRLRGYRCALLEAGFCPEPDLICGMGAASGDDALRDLTSLLVSPDRPTAVVCANDDMALFLMRLCRNLDLKIPDDISVVGFDDVPLAADADPPLTTVRVNKEFLGRLAVQRLRDRVKNATGTWQSRTPIRHVAPVSLVVRSSCCPPS